MKFSAIIHDIAIWRERNLNPRQFMLILSLACGLAGGLAAVFLKNVVHHTNTLLLERLHAENLNWLYIALPLVGILLTVLFVKYLIKEDISHGVSKILYAISRKNSHLKPHNNYSSLVGSTFTVGFGGSVGLEAPIVLTGASMGSSLGKLFHLNYKQTTLLIGCGAAGAIAGIFKAPIAAVVFGLEVLMLDLTMMSIIPLLISAVTGALVATFLLGENILFTFKPDATPILHDILWYILLGVISGFISLYFTKGSLFLEKKISAFQKPLQKSLAGGAILGLLIFLFPPLYGEGYSSLRALLHENLAELPQGSFLYNIQDQFWVFTGYLFLILLFKMIATSVTTGSGGVGGVFAPSLFMGGFLGYIMARIINYTGFAEVSTKNFTLVGMAGLMAGIMHAPLTAIFLIAEISGGYELFIPLIVTSTISFITINYFEETSIYTHHLAKRGDLITHHKDKAALTLMNIQHVIEKNFNVLHPWMRLGEFVNIIKASKRNVFPVVDKEHNMVGIVTLNDVRSLIFETDKYDKILVEDVMYFPETHVKYSDTLQEIANKIERTGRYNVPVLEDGKYLGFISRAKVFSEYRKMIRDFSED